MTFPPLPLRPLQSNPQKPSIGLSCLIFIVLIGAMAFLRLYLFPKEFIALTYALPMIVCLWYRDRRLLWSMAVAFMLMSTYKAFVLKPDARLSMDRLEWAMQLTSIAVLATAVHLISLLTDQLRSKNLALEEANALLAARDEEITQQNEELSAQAEELQQQNEEIQQQSRELERQAGELRIQADQLKGMNVELGHREQMLQTLLESFRGPVADRQVLERICRSLLGLFGGDVAASAIVERSGDQVELQAHAGNLAPADERWPFRNSLTSLVISKGRTAYVDDLAARTDLGVLRPKSGIFRSVLAAPLELSGSPVGTVQVYAERPRDWTSDEFTLIEWVASQCSLVMETRRLQKEIEATNERLDQQVRERTRTLRSLVDELEHFSYTITHDMRAPLRAMQGYAQLIEERCLPSLSEEGKDFLRRIMTAASRMDRLITDALNYSSSGREAMTFEKIEPQDLLRGMVDSYPTFQLPRARIVLPERMPPIRANAAGVTQCFSNLLSNAVKFVEEGRVPEVNVRTELTRDRVRIWFEDNGIGISPEMMPRIFGMFQRASNKYEGTGIGLALVKKVAERMGGKVGAESVLGKGSRFWIEFLPWTQGERHD